MPLEAIEKDKDWPRIGSHFILSCLDEWWDAQIKVSLFII